MKATLLRLSAAAVAVTASVLTASPLLSPAGAQQGGPDAPPPVVVVSDAAMTQMSESVVVPGSVVSRNDAQIAAEVAGVVSEVAEIGTLIEKDGIIAKIDPELLQLEADRADASVKRLEARVTFLESEVKRLEALAEKGSATRQRLDQARSERDMARQDLAEARIALQRAQYDLAHAEVRTPFPGRVVTRLIQPGEYIERGRPVARVVDVTSLDVTAQIPIASVSQLKEGDLVTIEGPGRTISAKVRALVPVGDEVSRAAELRAALEDAVWLVGTAVKVATPTEPPRDVLSVPRDAVLLRAEGTAVFRINGESMAELVPVKTGLVVADRIEVIGDLKAGDKVVIRGGETLQPGQKVQIQALTEQASTSPGPG